MSYAQQLRNRRYVDDYLVLTDFDKTLADLRVDLPESLAVLIRTTNRLERFHEMRRKQRDIGMVQSAASCEAIWYLLATRETAKQQAELRGRA